MLPRIPIDGRSPRREFLSARLRRSGELFRSARYREAAASCQADYELARNSLQFDFAAKFLANLAGCRFALHQYREALEVFAQARRLAQESGNASAAAVIDANISSVYEQMGEWDAAAAYARRGAERLEGNDRRLHLPKVLIHMASLRARQGRPEEAAALFAAGIAGADAAGDQDTYALGWDRLGEERFKRGDLARAETAMLEAWRVRKLQKLAALGTSYRNLGRLRLAQGDLRSAEVLLDRAVESVRAPRGLMPTWDVYHARGLVRLARGEEASALDDLRVAARLASVWRAGISPADATRASSEEMLEPVHASWAHAAAGLYFRTRRPELLAESFQAAEENRAGSLRAQLAQPREQLPPEYWETLARLDACEVALVRQPGDARVTAEVEGLRAALAAVENRAAPLQASTESGLLERLQLALPADAAYFGFQLGEPESYLWAVDRAGAALYRLPGRRVLGPAARAFDDAVRDDGPDAAQRGAALYKELFGGVARRFTARPRWLLALDNELLAVPVAALHTGGGFLVERHTVQVVSGAGLVAREHREGWRGLLAGPFLGVGDPVYNTADGRWKGSRSHGGSFTASAAAGVKLPRLVGSAREIELCAAEWAQAGATLLQGPQATRGGLRRALAARPAVAHLATHILESAGRSRHGLIALSLDPAGNPEVLDPLEITAWNAAPGMVTLSGCSSGAVRPAPGAARSAPEWSAAAAGMGLSGFDLGLVGLTRAWLAAGAGAVVATRWPARDGTGEVVRSLYRHLRARPEAGPAAALARAQVEMLKAGGWRSRPQYWGAYFVVTNQ